MNNKLLYYGLFLFSVFISSFSQILLKQSALENYDIKIKEFLNIKVISAYSIFLISTVLTTIAYKEVPLYLGPVLESTGYIYISILSYFILKESLTKKQLMGNIFIILGILISSL